MTGAATEPRYMDFPLFIHLLSLQESVYVSTLFLIIKTRAIPLQCCIFSDAPHLCGFGQNSSVLIVTNLKHTIFKIDP